MPDRTATPTVASALLLDDVTLAGRARTTLAAADVVTVVGPTPLRVTVQDRDGEPEITAVPDALRELVGRGRRTTVVVSPRLDDGVWLVLDGRLVEREGAVVLAVEAVWVGCPHGHGHARPLDLDAYATALPDAVRASIPRLVEHTNEGHGPELREVARRSLGVPGADIAAASLCELDPAGVTLRVVDLDGVSDVRLRFPRPASTPGDLLGLLRMALTSA
ncbi:DUF2470 domain-containing protein [Jatrophihabitans sp. YIM 134969]